MEQRTIHVTGEGKKSYKPDQLIVRLDYQELWPGYDSALYAASGYTGVIKEKAVLAGLDEKSVTTHSFSVSPKTTSVKDEHGHYKSHLLGYEAHVGFSIKLAVDNDLLSRLLYALRDHEGGIRFYYGLSEKAKVSEEVMELAVKEAMHKAKVLAKASGQTLGDILNIDYSYGRITFEREHILYECAGPCGIDEPPEIDIDPEELEVKDTVNITWELK